jgi:glycosyltransferase 2 family protein
MESVVRRAYALVCAIPPRVVLAAKLAFALLAIAIVGRMVDWPTVAANLNGLFFWILAGIGLFMVPMHMVLALRWKLLIGSETPRHFSFLTALRGWCLGLFFNLLMPGLVAGEVVRAHYASVRAQIRYPRSFLVVLTERLFGLLSLCLLASIGVALNDHLDRFTPVPATQLAFGLAAVAASILLGVGLTRRYTRVRVLLFPLLLLLSIAGQSLDVLLVHIYGRAVSVNIPLETLLLVIPLVFLASVVPLTPGGHGVREVALTALLTLAGIPATEAALIALMLFVTEIGIGFVSGVALHSLLLERSSDQRSGVYPILSGPSGIHSALRHLRPLSSSNETLSSTMGR